MDDIEELNACCKLVTQVKDREMAKAVDAAQQAGEFALERAVVAAREAIEKEVERLEARIAEVEKIAFEKAKMVSGLEGEIAGLRYKLGLVPPVGRPQVNAAPVQLTVPPMVAPVSLAPVHAPLAVPPMVAPVSLGPETKCSMCGKPCSSMCPSCKVYVCDRYDCGVKHGHGEMYTSST